MKLKRDRLQYEEYEKYLQIGEVDPSQNWLELFTTTLVSDIFQIIDASSDNQDKADAILEELSEYGFEAVGLGTNILTVSNLAYPGVVFKIALDDYGLADNFNDTVLYEMVNSYLSKDRYTKVLARHHTGVVTVQERKVIVRNQDRMDAFRKDILKTLDYLAEAFLIVDLSPNFFHLNYGIDRNGDWCFIDASDLYPLKRLKEPLRCHMTATDPKHPGRVATCGGDLVYNEDYSRVCCTKCGRSYIPADVRPKDEGGNQMANTVTDGMSIREIREMDALEMEELLRRQNKGVKVPDRDLIAMADDSVRQVQDAYLREVNKQQDRKIMRDLKIDPEVREAVTERIPAQLEKIADALEPDEEDDAPATVRPPEKALKMLEKIPEGRPVRVQPKRQSAFIRPRDVEMVQNPPKKAEPTEEEELVEEAITTELPVERVRDLSTSFTEPQHPIEDDEDDEEDGVEIIQSTTAIVNMTPGVPTVMYRKHEEIQVLNADPEPDDDDDEEEDEPEEEPKVIIDPKIDYSILMDEDDDGEPMGILVNIEGELQTAYYEYGLPIFVSIDGGRTIHHAIGAGDLYEHIAKAYKTAVEEANSLKHDEE